MTLLTLTSALLLGLASMTSLTGCSQAEPAATGVRADILEQAFQPASRAALVAEDVEVPGQIVALRQIDRGSLGLPSGRVVAGDPFVSLMDQQPFSFRVPPGRYPVRLAVAEIGPRHFRVALARVDFSRAPVAAWRMATIEGQDAATLEPDEIFGYGVDAGLGGFADPKALQWMTAEAPSGRLETLMLDTWLTAGEVEGRRAGFPHVFLLSPEVLPDANVVMFSSGWGDGFYASWVGYDAAGAPVALVTDFGVIEIRDLGQPGARAGG